MTALDRTILAHIFNAKTQPTVADLACAAKVDQHTVLATVKDLWHRRYLEILYANYQLHFRMTCYGMAMTYLSCVVRDAGKKKSTQVSCGTVEGHGEPKHCLGNGSPSKDTGAGKNAVGTQAPPAGKHFALSSVQGVESGKGAESPSSISAPQIQQLPAITEETVSKVLSNHGLCPQGPDCIGDPRAVVRIHKCDSGCGFKGCIACVMDHEREPHWSDSDTARERFGGMTVIQGGKL